jgi:DNA topoisomerase I
MADPQAEWAANGSPGTRGTCSVCGGKMYRQGHTEAHETLPKPEITAKPRKSKSKGKSQPATRRAGKLVIVESPAKAKTIGRYLGKGYTVKPSLGHVRDLLRSRLSVDVENDYEPEYRVPNDKRQVVKDLKAAAAKASQIYLATDPDREGEAIAWHVMEAAEMEPERTQRVVFNEITKPAILEAFEHPREIDMKRVDAQQARRILDRLVGYGLSPLLWRKVRGRLSAGRVQSVALRLVVDREREIDAFVPVEYWSIDADVSQQMYASVNGNKANGRPFFQARLHKVHGEDPVLGSEEEVQPHLEALERAEWTVSKVKVGKRTRKPSAPYTTSTMQQDASRKLSFGTTKSMRIAQQLYEGVDIGAEEGVTGLITYMRTDSVTVSADAQRQAREYVLGEFGEEYIPDSPPLYKTKSKTAQEAHEAIRPTAVAHTPASLKKLLSRDQYRLYKLIWERFVASQMAPAIYDTVSADIMAGPASVTPDERPYLFRASGSTLSFEGFLAIFGDGQPDDDEEETALTQVPPDLYEGEEVDLLRLLPEQHFTQPPPRYSEASLVKELEENGIGRPSTYAMIVSTIQQRGYVEQDQRRLYPTEIGLIVTDLLVEYFPDVVSTDFTANLEDELDEITQGKPWVPVIDDFYTDFARELEAADEALPKMDLKKEAEPVGRDCPETGHPLVYREGRYGRFIGCSDFPRCRYSEQILVTVGVTCPKCGGELIEKRTRKGRLFYGCSNYPECDWTNWKRPVPEPCPVCNGVMVMQTKDMLKCTQCDHMQEFEPAEVVATD